MLEWRRYCPFVSPAFFQALSERACRNAESFGPLHGGEGFAIVGYQDVVASISRLAVGQCPPDVPRLIVPIVVDPVQRVLPGWPGANIPKERLEVIPPLVANLDATATVS